MVYTTVSSKQVISKFFRDTRANISMESDAVEWIAEALDFIGVTPRLIHKTRILEITNYSTRLPDDLQQIEFVHYNPDATEETEISEYTHLLFHRSSSYSRRLHHKVVPQNGTQSTITQNEFYTVVPAYIKTSFEKGYIALFYKGYPLDEEGYPMIPDHTVIKEALTWFLIMKSSGLGWVHPAGLNYIQIEERWLRYCSQARVKLKAFDVEQYRELASSWLKLAPSPDLSIPISTTEEFNDVQEYVDTMKGITND